MTAWNLRPLGWRSLSSLPSLSLLILLVVQSAQRARILSLYSHLPLWPRASQQMLTISSGINKTSHSTAVPPGPRPVGGAGELECLTLHPPHCITWQNEKWLTMSPLQLDHPGPTATILHGSAHTWKGNSQEIGPPTARGAQGGSDRGSLPVGSPGWIPCVVGLDF